MKIFLLFLINLSSLDTFNFYFNNEKQNVESELSKSKDLDHKLGIPSFIN